MVLGSILARNAALRGRETAIFFEGRDITHGQLRERVCRLANALLGLGVRRQERISFLGQNCPEILEMYWAVSECGFIGHGLNYRLSAAEQIQILRDCRPTVLIFEPQYARRVAEICAGLEQAPILIVTGNGEGPGAGLESLGYETLLAAAAPQQPTLQARPDDTVYLIYTSGTTGKPKGVMHGHAGQYAQAQICSATFRAREEDRFLLVMPLYHIGGLNCYMAYAWCGGAVVLHRGFEPVEVYQSLNRHRISAALLAPIMIQALLETPEPVRSTPHFLQNVVYSSAPMPVPLLRRAIAHFGPVFTQVYGATENATATVLHQHLHRPEGTPEEARRLASAGQPYFRCEVQPRHPDGRACVAGEVGEVTVASPSMMQGYWNNSVATHEALRDGWYYSGDMGYLDEDGFLYLVDRKKDMIISGGENIYSREVEEALLSHPAVYEVAVIGVPDAKWGEAVMAVVVCRGMAPTGDELILHCREQIASYKKPRAIEFIEALPRVASTNKVDKKRLREMYAGSV
jgi:acyl-CoA synthetase (AMP-forming)/AMP-acid ligase II